MVTGPKTINRTFTLSEIPVYVRAGSIIPMRTDDFGQSVYMLNMFSACLNL